MHYNEVITEAKSNRTFHVYWGINRKQRMLGYYVIEAPNEREARREAKRYLDARLLGGKYYIAWTVDLEKEAEEKKSRE